MSRFSIQQLISNSWASTQESVKFQLASATESVKVQLHNACESGAKSLVDIVDQTSKIMERASTFKNGMMNRVITPVCSEVYEVYSDGAKAVRVVKSMSVNVLKRLWTGGTWAGHNFINEVAKPAGSAFYYVGQASFFAGKELATSTSQTIKSGAKAATPIVKDFGSAMRSVVYATYVDGKDVMIGGAQAIGKGASAAKQAPARTQQAWTRLMHADEKVQMAAMVITSLAVYIPLHSMSSAIGKRLWGDL